MKMSPRLIVILFATILALLASGCPGSSYTLILHTSGQGTVQTNPSATTYESGMVVAITATADSGYVFDHWTGDLSGSTNPASVTMNRDKTITAVFLGSGTGPGDCTEWTQVDVETNTTIPAGCYLVNSDMTVHAGAVLTLSSGVTLKFAQGTRLKVSFDGALNAVGTAANPIELSAQNKTRGAWDGLELDDSNSASNILDYVTVEYGGGGGANYSANLTVYGTTRIAITNCTFRQSAAPGVWVSSTGNVTSFAGNTLTQNMDAPISLDVNQVGVLTDTSTYSGNDADYIKVWGNSTDKDQTWSSLGVPYHITESFTVDHHTTLAAGVQLFFARNLKMLVNRNGSLTAQGTAASDILLSSTDDTAGYWNGLELDDSNSANNILDYVTIEYGGGGGASYSANLTAYGTTRIAITNCTFRQSAAPGVWVSSTGNITSFAGNTLTQNMDAPISLDVNQVGVLTNTSAYSGNDADYIKVWGNSTDKDQTWSSLGVPYHITESFTVDHHTTLAAGVQLFFARNLKMLVNRNGSLTAQGTAASDILLSSTDDTAGYWNGLELDDSNSANNILDYVTIEYGGGGGASYSANLTAYGTTHVQVTHCSIQHSAAAGVWYSRTATINGDLATANIFTDNAGGNVVHP
ncbi:InlB B-repeat-containing protein [Sorangium sp. So ce388]|uniref:InlB B-repeat-containing protein n=1 Tax=Sorangium sp. So ce388 TaxID=3133309 RepID=UPI003F5B7D2A